MTATTPAHGRSVVPESCLCQWTLRTSDADGAMWWQMILRSRHCPLHRMPGETGTDEASPQELIA